MSRLHRGSVFASDPSRCPAACQRRQCAKPRAEAVLHPAMMIEQSYFDLILACPWASEGGVITGALSRAICTDSTPTCFPERQDHRMRHFANPTPSRCNTCHPPRCAISLASCQGQGHIFQSIPKDSAQLDYVQRIECPEAGVSLLMRGLPCCPTGNAGQISRRALWVS